MQAQSLLSLVIIVVLAYIALRVTVILVRGLLGLVIVALLIYFIMNLMRGGGM